MNIFFFIPTINGGAFYGVKISFVQDGSGRVKSVLKKRLGAGPRSLPFQPMGVAF
jgi:hypothetical protein